MLEDESSHNSQRNVNHHANSKQSEEEAEGSIPLFNGQNGQALAIPNGEKSHAIKLKSELPATPATRMRSNAHTGFL